MQKRILAAVAALAVIAVAPASAAPARASQPSDLRSQYATWAGGPENAQQLVNGLRQGTSVTLVTRQPGQRMSLAGFTPARALSDDEISSALASARRELSRLGIERPSAEQIQAALIGGEVESRGRLVNLRGPVPSGPLASR